MVQKLAWLFAIVFLAIGILGFVPGITSDGMLLGIFDVDTTHNIIHLVSGLIALIAAVTSASASSLFFKIFGLIYAIVAVAGFVQGDTVLGLISVNAADNWLHVVLAIVSLAIGFGVKTANAPAPAMGQPMM